MPKRRQAWKPGDVFVVPQSDGVGTIGQVLDHMMTSVVSCAFYDIRVPLAGSSGPFDLTDDLVISGLSVTTEMLDDGEWPVVGWQPVALEQKHWPNENTRDQQWIGSEAYDASVAEELLEAYNGLTAWDNWKDPNFLDTLLANPDRKPKHLIFKKPDKT